MINRSSKRRSRCAGRGERFVIPVQAQDLPIRAAVNQNLFGCDLPLLACRRDIAYPARDESNSIDLPNQNRNMRKHRSVTGSVTLPIIVETFDGVFERGVVFEESVHTDDPENIAQEWAHARELEIAVQVAQKL